MIPAEPSTNQMDLNRTNQKQLTITSEENVFRNVGEQIRDSS